MRHVPSPEWSWGDVLTVVHMCPDDSPLRRSQADCGHTLIEHLLMMSDYTLAVQVWQAGRARRQDMPKLPDCMVRPEMRETQQYGTAAMTLDQMDEWLSHNKRAA